MRGSVALLPLLALAATALPGPVPASAPASPEAAESQPPPPSPAPETATVSGFAQMVRYGRAAALARNPQSGSISAILSDPFALDGRRARFPAGQQHIMLIDLDPAGGTLVPPATPERQQGLILSFAVLREAGIAIRWISDLPVEEAGRLRTALELSGLDPRDEDIISLRPENQARKQEHREYLAKTACITAIGGDERADFDERFRYLKNPAAGADLDKVIGDGWFLIDPVFPVDGEKTK